MQRSADQNAEYTTFGVTKCRSKGYLHMVVNIRKYSLSLLLPKRPKHVLACHCHRESTARPPFPWEGYHR